MNEGHTMEERGLIVIGAGPAGSSAAKVAAEWT